MRKIEDLEPFSIEQLLADRCQKLKALLKAKQLKVKRSIEGRLRIARSHGTYQYCVVTDKTDKNGKYIPKSETVLPKMLAQKEYEQKLIPSLKNEIKLLTTFLAKWNDNSLNEVYEKMNEAKKEFVEPVILSDEEFVRQWNSVEYKQRAEKYDCKMVTGRGELVRSKSEVIIADTLARYKIPYRYEMPLVVKTNGLERREFRPDFCCLRVRDRKEFLWEHFGMMSDSEYASSAVKKIQVYQHNGIFIGDRLLVSFENYNNPLTVKTVEGIIKKWLL